MTDCRSEQCRSKPIRLFFGRAGTQGPKHSLTGTNPAACRAIRRQSECWCAGKPGETKKKDSRACLARVASKRSGGPTYQSDRGALVCDLRSVLHNPTQFEADLKHIPSPPVLSQTWTIPMKNTPLPRLDVPLGEFPCAPLLRRWMFLALQPIDQRFHSSSTRCWNMRRITGTHR